MVSDRGREGRREGKRRDEEREQERKKEFDIGNHVLWSQGDQGISLAFNRYSFQMTMKSIVQAQSCLFHFSQKADL